MVGLLSSRAAWFTACASIAASDLACAEVPESSAGGMIEEIVVTAQKRDETWSKISASLAVISGAELDNRGITTAINLQDQVPNVVVGRAYDGAVDLTIRGISSSDDTNKGDPAVALNIDGVYVGRPQAAGAAFYDLERVEVLRGPQGTLYGRNANAGAINVISRRPSDSFESAIDVGFGNYSAREIDAMVNVPLTSGIAMRGVVSYQAHDGYSHTTDAVNRFTHNQDDLDNLSGRLLLLARLSPQATLLMGVDASHNGGAGAAVFFGGAHGEIPYSRTKTNEVEGSYNDRGTNEFLQLDYNFGPTALTYVFGHRMLIRKDILDLSGGAPGVWAYSDADTWQVSHELRLASSGDGALKWVTGLYWYKEDGTYSNFDLRLPHILGSARIIQYLQAPTISKSRAVFGQASYTVASGTRLILGVRGTWDDKSRLGIRNSDIGLVPGGTCECDDASGSWHKVTWKTGLEHDLPAGALTYATISTGYKAGGFNDGNAQNNPDLYYNPESITAYEVGVKGRAGGGRVLASADVFYYDYSNLQKSTAANNSIVTVNAAKASVKGLELDARAAITDHGRLNLGVGLLRAQYNSYIAPDGQSLSGADLDKAPRATVTLGYSHEISSSRGLRLTPYVGTRYMSSYTVSDPGTASLAPQSFTQKSTTKTEISLTLGGIGERWSLQVYGRNLEDKSTVGGLIQNAGNYYIGFNEPRTYGVRGNARF